MQKHFCYCCGDFERNGATDSSPASLMSCISGCLYSHTASPTTWLKPFPFERETQPVCLGTWYSRFPSGIPTWLHSGISSESQLRLMPSLQTPPPHPLHHTEEAKPSLLSTDSLRTSAPSVPMLDIQRLVLCTPVPLNLPPAHLLTSLQSHRLTQPPTFSASHSFRLTLFPGKDRALQSAERAYDSNSGSLPTTTTRLLPSSVQCRHSEWQAESTQLTPVSPEPPRQPGADKYPGRTKSEHV